MIEIFKTTAKGAKTLALLATAFAASLLLTIGPLVLIKTYVGGGAALGTFVVVVIAAICYLVGLELDQEAKN